MANLVSDEEMAAYRRALDDHRAAVLRQGMQDPSTALASAAEEMVRGMVRTHFASFPADGSLRDRIEWVGTSDADVVVQLAEERPKWRALVVEAERAGAARRVVLDRIAAL